MTSERELSPQTGAKTLRFPAKSTPRVVMTLWNGSGKPDMETLRAILVAEGCQVIQWGSEPHDGFPPHGHIYPETIWLIEGSLTCLLPSEKRILELAPGDRLETPSGTIHAIVAGPDGARYLIATH